MIPAIRRLMSILPLFLFILVSQAQPAKEETLNKDPMPYKVLTTGKQITLKSSKNIQNVMLWTVNGYRVIEHKNINSNTCSFTIPINDKAFYLMVGMSGGKIYTEKIGVR